MSTNNPIPPLLLVLILLLRIAHGDNHMKPVRLRVSHASQMLYKHYRENTCRKGIEYNNEDAYLTWEEKAFLEKLRITLEPKSVSGDFSDLYEKGELKLFDSRMLYAKEESLCEKFNDTEMKRKQKEKEERDTFEDAVLNIIFPN